MHNAHTCKRYTLRCSVYAREGRWDHDGSCPAGSVSLQYNALLLNKLFCLTHSVHSHSLCRVAVLVRWPSSVKELP